MDAKKQLTISPKGVEFIAAQEGLILHPYLDAGRLPTIGYGSTYYENGHPVTMQDAPITKERAKQLLLFHIKLVADKVAGMVTATLKQQQFDALCSFGYNLGTNALMGSTLLKLINANPADHTISSEFSKWCHCKGEVLDGLVKRRSAEAAMYFS